MVQCSDSAKYTEECRHCLALVEQGRIRAHLEPLILHELSYALPRHRKQITPTQGAEILLMILSWHGVRGENCLMIDAEVAPDAAAVRGQQAA